MEDVINDFQRAVSVSCLGQIADRNGLGRFLQSRCNRNCVAITSQTILEMNGSLKLGQ